MINLEQRAQADIPTLRDFVGRLLALNDTKLMRVACRGDDHLGFMALCLLAKQAEHARSILLLGESRDVQLIARSALESLCYLLWAAQEPDKRALQWRAFSFVHDWRLLRKQQLKRIVVDPSRVGDIENALLTYGPLFYTEKAKKNKDKGRKLPDDPYRQTWTDYTIKQTFEAVKAQLLYSELYGHLSDWTHSSAVGLASAISYAGQDFDYTSKSLAEAATALATVIHCLIQTIEFVDSHLRLQIASDISDGNRSGG